MKKIKSDNLYVNAWIIYVWSIEEKGEEGEDKSRYFLACFLHMKNINNTQVKVEKQQFWLEKMGRNKNVLLLCALGCNPLYFGAFNPTAMPPTE